VTLFDENCLLATFYGFTCLTRHQVLLGSSLLRELRSKGKRSGDALPDPLIVREERANMRLAR
jgi:hypothetical protein